MSDFVLRTVNPSNAQVIEEYGVYSQNAVDHVLEDAYTSFLWWRLLQLKERVDYLNRFADHLEAQLQHVAYLISQEMGKPIQQARAEIEKSVTMIRSYTENAQTYMADESIPGEGNRYVCYQPQGVLLVITPWNFPFGTVLRSVVPNLLLGNAVVVKPAPNVTGCGLMLERLFKESGFRDTCRMVITSNDVTQRLIAHKKVIGVTFTGSTAVGRQVAAIAGQALKKCVLELGGSDPYLILEDADIDLAARICVQHRFSNAGQICVAAKRLVVVQSVYEAFRERILTYTRNYRLGDPLVRETTMGPLARQDLRDHLHQQVMESIVCGAVVLLGGAVPDTRGFFYPPTVLADVRPGMPAYDEELFGPVISLIRVRDVTEAVRVANDTPYGLGAAVFTQNIVYAEKLARQRLEAGMCFINQAVVSDAQAPFGGVKQSGFGRELGVEGVRSFANQKLISIATADDALKKHS